MCNDGATVRATVVIERSLGDRWSDPNLAAGFGEESRRAAETRGKSVLVERVLGQTNPPLRWLVERMEVRSDPDWDPEDTGRCRTCRGAGRVDPRDIEPPARSRCPECQGIDPWTEDDYLGTER